MSMVYTPRAWLCELMMEDGTTRTQIVEQDPDGLRWNDAGEPSPYRVTPLYGPEVLADAADLLAALQAMHAYLSAGASCAGWTTANDKACAAIAKATGAES